MHLEQRDATLVKATFALLNRGSATSFPQPLSLSRALEPLVPAADPLAVIASPTIAKAFATASVDAWLRSVHSFLISISVTGTSPIWASVAGYYSSHYAVRAISHLLGMYLLFSKKRMVRLTLEDGKYYLSFAKRDGADREHKVYWKQVKGVKPFRGNPLFCYNNFADAVSDVGHRDRANYADHLSRYYLKFGGIDELAARRRIQKIARTMISTPPVPRKDQFPDLDSVQIIAYHRLVSYRTILDETLSSTSRFWANNRMPTFAGNFLDFQLIESTSLSDFGWPEPS